MDEMFHSCFSLDKIILFNISAKNTTTMREMLYNCSSLKELDFSNFKTKM
jgi:hypothetical protein